MTPPPRADSPTTFRIVTLGCAKNQVDSEAMRQLLEGQGYASSDEDAPADLVIVNTCGFIEAAKQESIDVILQEAERKQDGQRLVATGCLSERYRRELLSEIPEIDAMVGARNWASLPRVVERLLDPASDWQPDSSLRLMEMAPAGQLDLVMPPRQATGPSAYVKISDGCDQKCAFCAIPSMKGLHRSKSPELVLSEIGQLVEQGVREVVLIGQDTTRYGHDLEMPEGLARLLEAICDRYPALAWIRLMYAYPRHVTPELLRVMAEREQVCKYMDMPLQHTHPETLRRMRRPHRGVDELIDWLRQGVPGLTLRTTFIVGFPGESEEEFEHLCRSVERSRFDRVGVFTYSDEDGTPAADLPGRVPRRVRERRRETLMRIAQRVSREQNQHWVGKRIRVLIEGTTVADGMSMLVGRSERDAPEVDGLVLVSGAADVGSMVQVRVTAPLDYDLMGVIERAS